MRPIPSLIKGTLSDVPTRRDLSISPRSYTVCMATYFLLDETLTPIPIGDDLFRWASWHTTSRALCLIGDDLLPDGSRILTWFYGRERVLWETLWFDASGQVIARRYAGSYEEALCNHLQAVLQSPAPADPSSRPE